MGQILEVVFLGLLKEQIYFFMKVALIAFESIRSTAQDFVSPVEWQIRLQKYLWDAIFT